MKTEARKPMPSGRGAITLNKLPILASAFLLASTAAYAASSTAITFRPAEACLRQAPTDLCTTSLWVDLRNVTAFSYSVKGTAYNVSDSSDGRVFVEYLSAAGRWSCLGTLPCNTLVVRNTPPDQFGNVNRTSAMSARIVVPAHQRLAKTQIRVTTANEGNVARLTMAQVQLFYP